MAKAIDEHQELDHSVSHIQGEIVMHRRLVTLIILLTANLAWASDSQCPASANRASFTLSQLSAAAIALVRFKKDQPAADERNVLITISESDKEFKVAFSPRPNPSEVGHDGNMDYITMDNPRGNQYGNFVEYRISKKLRRIVGEIGAR